MFFCNLDYDHLVNQKIIMKNLPKFDITCIEKVEIVTYHLC